MKKLPIVVLLSGRGSNLKAIIDAQDPLVEIRAVISNKLQAGGLFHAKQANIKTEVVDHKKFKTRSQFDQALQTCIDKYHPQLVVLAGFMRILSAEFVNHYQGHIINIHPSLLPAFKGLHTHKQALEAKVKQHGASVHFLTAELDAGPVIIQAKVPVLPDDNEDILAARVLNEEHLIYPQAIHWFAEGRIKLDSKQVFLDNQPIEV
ncbi:MAG: phosphoribosylglycinamide formyltransferase [Candidatus Marithrix sp.]|nr:phosphoribosylglycinamide formyltransferase [Candidatus Marithrix sp.]